MKVRPFLFFVPHFLILASKMLTFGANLRVLGINMAKKSVAKLANYHGMTVNERLHTSGLLNRFNAAARQGNRRVMIAMLKRLALPKKYAEQWVDTLLGDQNFFCR